MSDDGSTRDRGRAVESHVAAYLERQGVEIVDRNFASAGAEIDLIGVHDSGGERVYVFIEVRSRKRDDLGDPVETVGAQKQRRIVKAATAWLVARDLWEKVPVRFDVVGVNVGDERVAWIRGAFEA